MAGGKVAGITEIKARWAFSEIVSSRLAAAYRSHVCAEALELAARREHFDAVPQSLWPDLISALRAVRSAEFVSLLDHYGTETFECVHWRASDLLSCQTLPQYEHVPFFSFLAHPMARDGTGRVRGNDPRHEANRIRPGFGVKLVEPAIAGINAGRPILLDGYLRAILWLRQPAASFPVWLPVTDRPR